MRFPIVFVLSNQWLIAFSQYRSPILTDPVGCYAGRYRCRFGFYLTDAENLTIRFLQNPERAIRFLQKRSVWYFHIGKWFSPMSTSLDGLSPGPLLVEGRFDDIDAMASSPETERRAGALSDLLQHLTTQSNDDAGTGLSQVAARIFDVILDMVPSAEVIEPLHSRARIAREVLRHLQTRLDDPPSIAELCVTVGARERTLHLSCVEAFGRPPAALLAELRLNAAIARC
jgi:hypothetical protein